MKDTLIILTEHILYTVNEEIESTDENSSYFETLISVREEVQKLLNHIEAVM